VHLTEDNAVGASSKNGTWNGVIRMLMDHEVDVAVADITMTSRRAPVVDFSIPLIISRYIIQMRIYFVDEEF
jgi:ABC-type amino acid transport substrate-binding protein